MKKQPTKSDLLWDEKAIEPNYLGLSVKQLKMINPTAKVGLYVGDFDELTPSDCVFLQLCRVECDILVVAIPDGMSLRLQNKSAKYDTAERAFRLGSMSFVSYLVKFSEEIPSLVLDTVQPDFIFYGRTANDKEQYSYILQKDKLTFIDYPWRDERIEGKFFNI